MIDIKYFNEISKQNSDEITKEPTGLVTPGDIITVDDSFTRGHGTYGDSQDNTRSSLCGTFKRISNLYSVTGLRVRYEPEIGDVVVGRIVELQQRRWLVDVNGCNHAVLHLSSVNLPGFENKINTEEDKYKMRKFLAEGDAISAEVRAIYQDGSACLYITNAPYGKLGQGILVKVNPYAIKRSKNHFHDITSGVQVILSSNGLIWISIPNTEEEQPFGGFRELKKTGGRTQNLIRVSVEDREILGRVKNCIQALASNNRILSDSAIHYAYAASQKYLVKDMLKTEVMKEICNHVEQMFQHDTS